MTTSISSSSDSRGRERVPLHSDDLSQFAKTLRQQLADHLRKSEGTAPSHVQMLNMLARAAGHRSVQALRAQALLKPSAPAPAAAEAPASLRSAASSRHQQKTPISPSAVSHCRPASARL